MNRPRIKRTSTSTYSRVLVAALAVLISISAAAQTPQAAHRFPASAQLDGAGIREAIAFGEGHKPEPYWLYPNPEVREATVAVYTPFIRVALAAYTAKQRGETLSIASLPEWITERNIHVVVRPPDRTVSAAQASFPNDPPLSETPITGIALLARDRPNFLDPAPAKWMTTDLSYLDMIGGPPFRDAAAAAAFEPDQMTRNLDVFGWWRKDNHFFPSQGYLDPTEIRNWH